MHALNETEMRDTPQVCLPIGMDAKGRRWRRRGTSCMRITTYMKPKIDQSRTSSSSEYVRFLLQNIKPTSYKMAQGLQ